MGSVEGKEIEDPLQFKEGGRQIVAANTPEPAEGLGPHQGSSAKEPGPCEETTLPGLHRGTPGTQLCPRGHWWGAHQ